jgi:tyrosine-protein kinase Etk/Wzc
MQTDMTRGETYSPANETHTTHYEDTSFENMSSINLGEMLQTLRAEKLTILLIAAATLLLSIAIALVIPVTYTAFASFIPPSSNSSSLSSLAGQLSAVGAGAALGAVKSNGDLYVGILGSKSISQSLVAKFDLKRVYKVKKESAAERILSSRSIFESGIRDGIVTLKITDHNAELARDLANGYLEELHNTSGRLALTEAAQRRLFYEQQLAREKDNLANAEVQLKIVQERTGLIAPAGQATVEIETIARTQAEIASRKVQLSALSQSATDQNPQVIRLRSEISNLQGQLASLERGAGQSNSISIPTSKLPESELQFVRQQREVKYHEALFEIVAKQYEAARLDESRDAPVLQVLDFATLPDTKSGPPRTIIAIAGLFLGLILGASWVLFRNRANTLPD